MHSVFGRTVRGLDVLPQIKPDEAFTVRILRLGAAAQAFKADEATFKQLAAAAKPYAGNADSPAETLAKAEPGPAAHFDDSLKVLPTEVPRAKNFNYKLNNLQRATGLKVYARVYPTFAQKDDTQTPATFAKDLAGSLGIYQNGALAVYFADKDEWSLWIGDDLMATFNPGRERASAAKKTLYASVKAKTAEYTALAERIYGPERPITAADRAKFSVDAMLDLLIFQLEPKPKG